MKDIVVVDISALIKSAKFIRKINEKIALGDELNGEIVARLQGQGDDKRLPKGAVVGDTSRRYRREPINRGAD